CARSISSAGARSRRAREGCRRRDFRNRRHVRERHGSRHESDDEQTRGTDGGRQGSERARAAQARRLSTYSPSSSSTLARSAGVTGAATLTSRILGLVRDQVLAALFGAGSEMDAFIVAFRIPNVVRDLFAEGAMSA